MQVPDVRLYPLNDAEGSWVKGREHETAWMGDTIFILKKRLKEMCLNTYVNRAVRFFFNFFIFSTVFELFLLKCNQ